jgi:hypothetical protein
MMGMCFALGYMTAALLTVVGDVTGGSGTAALQ